MMRTCSIVLLVVATMFAACGSGDTFIGGANGKRVVATVDDKELLLRDVLADMPEGLTGIDSATFVRMYTDNWVLNQLKLVRADEVLTSHKDIDRLVNDYRQSLIMRQLDQYYVDLELDTDITDRQIAAHYRMHSSQFVLDHHKVRGVVVRVSDKFRNTSALSEAMRNVSGDGMVELNAFAEKHSLQISDLTTGWVTFSDFLSYLPTVRTRSYDNILQKGKVQSMKSDDIVFYYVITDVAKKGSVAPLECVEDDIRRMLYAERRWKIVKHYEQQLRFEAVESGRVSIDDTTLMESMSQRPKMHRDEEDAEESRYGAGNADATPRREEKKQGEKSDEAKREEAANKAETPTTAESEVKSEPEAEKAEQPVAEVSDAKADAEE